MKYSGSPFSHYIPDLECLPFSDSEASKILGITAKDFDIELKYGRVKKTVSILYRFDQSFLFTGLFDLFEYNLRKKLSLFVYIGTPEVDELVCSLVDEIASVIDISLYNEDKPVTLGNVIDNLQYICTEKQEIWRDYWLCNGERFSAEKCAHLTLVYWQSLFGKAMLELEALGYSDVSNVRGIPRAIISKTE
jgi:hypothetical protein